MYERYKKCLLFVVLFALLSTVFFTGFSNEAHAVTNANYKFSSFAKTDFVKCGNSNGQSRSAITAANSMINFDPADSWVFMGNSGTVATPTYQELWYVKAPGKITAYSQTPTTPVLAFKAPVDSGTAISWIVQGNSSGVGTTRYNMNGQGGSMKCYYSAYNVTYDQTWKDEWGGAFNQIPNAIGKYDCASTDYICKIKNIFTGIADTFVAVGEAIVNGFSALFTPDTTTLQYSFDELKTFLSDKLGFLVYPIEWTIDTFTLFVNTAESNDGWGIGVCSAINPPSIPGIGTPEIMGSSSGLSPSTWFCNVPEKLWIGAQWFFRITLTVAIFYMFNRRLHEVIGGRA